MPQVPRQRLVSEIDKNVLNHCCNGPASFDISLWCDDGTQKNSLLLVFFTLAQNVDMRNLEEIKRFFRVKKIDVC